MPTYPVAKVFCPKILSKYKPGFIIGWNLRSLIGCVATVVSETEVARVQKMLDVLSQRTDLMEAFDQCGGPPIILGRWRSTNESNWSQECKSMIRNSSLWLELELDEVTGLPVLTDVRAIGERYFTDVAQHIVLYDPPHPNHPLTVHAINLDLACNSFYSSNLAPATILNTAATTATTHTGYNLSSPSVPATAPPPAQPSYSSLSSHVQPSFFTTSISHFSTSSIITHTHTASRSSVNTSSSILASVSYSGSANSSANTSRIHSGASQHRRVGSSGAFEHHSSRHTSISSSELPPPSSTSAAATAATAAASVTASGTATTTATATSEASSISNALHRAGHIATKSHHSHPHPHHHRPHHSRRSTQISVSSVPSTRSHSPSGNDEQADALVPDMAIILHQINARIFVERALNPRRKFRAAFSDLRSASALASPHPSPGRFPATATLSTPRSALSSASSASSSASSTTTKNRGLLAQFSLDLLSILVLLLYAVGQGILLVLNTDLPFIFAYRKIKSLSATGSQIALRLTQLLSLPSQYFAMRKSWNTPERVCAVRVHLYNTIFNILIDVGLGLLLCLIILSLSPTCVDLLFSISESFYSTFIRNNVDWLMGWPAGFKSNDQLDHWLGTICITMLDLWNELLSVLALFYPYIVYVIAFSGFFGASMILAVVSDFFAFVGVHVLIMYTLATWIYSSQIRVIGVLWRLFRGKKFNVLRNRVDSCEYDLDQLLLGTLLFALMVFLLPTVGVYYVFFYITRSIVTASIGFLSAVQSVLNHFPGFAIFLYIFDPQSLPGGVHFEKNMNTTSLPFPSSASSFNSPSQPISLTYLELTVNRFPFFNLFYQYKKLVSNILRHHNPVTHLTSMITGKEIPTAPAVATELDLTTRQRNIVDLWLELRYLLFEPADDVFR